MESWRASRVRSRWSRWWIAVVVVLTDEKLLVHPLAVHFQVADFASEMFQINNLGANKTQNELIGSIFESVKIVIYSLLTLEWMVRESYGRLLLLLLYCFSSG